MGKIMEAVVKAIWGTDERCRSHEQRQAADQMLDTAERRVDRLNAKLDAGPPRNLDETMRLLTRSER